jgi:hypothetical protein
MPDFHHLDTSPVFEALGAAVFEAQHLERALYLLLQLLDDKPSNEKQISSISIDKPSAPQTIGQLFREVRMRKYLTPADKTLIQEGVRERNALVHAYWGDKRTMALLTPAGRMWLCNDLGRIREVCRKAGRVVDSIIDGFLKDYGSTLNGLSNPLWEDWESGEEPPPDVLH